MSASSSAAYAAFSPLLRYPEADLLERAEEAAALLTPDSPSERSMARFRESLAGLAPGEWEEAYTAAFDLQAVCCPYLGYQLFGESYKRGAFLVWLKEQCRTAGLDLERHFGNELPDHVAIVLRLLSSLEDPSSRTTIAQEALLPALAPMEQAFGTGSNPYGEVIRALGGLLRAEFGDVPPAPDWRGMARERMAGGFGCPASSCDGGARQEEECDA